jgi:hypothetical protein
MTTWAALVMRFRLDEGPALEVVLEVLQTEEARLGLIKELCLEQVDAETFETDPPRITLPNTAQVPECAARHPLACALALAE